MVAVVETWSASVQLEPALGAGLLPVEWDGGAIGADSQRLGAIAAAIETAGIDVASGLYSIATSIDYAAGLP